ncbi:type II toxin-antitoxin system MqsA family antitoxin [Methanospirillum hungatei]|uniref:type II toxin-antitoxin system MqsA family antitoxin n=1 Tax=Methanospirillum hungatei TaxID=2203 RepID=UPI0026EDA715|nr:type II toxin-antitoxin system MqsA family antitoxin [Methanospirillum hungatei]MCA1917593.1 type II toxin-antitoxin system MqsA family antitoxin [Methanospirillum hungatei]
MKCVQCNEGVTVDSFTTVAFEKNGVAFLFRHVPAMICPVCGEEYLSEEIQDRISEITNRCLEPGLSVNVYDFQAKPITA